MKFRFLLIAFIYSLAATAQTPHKPEPLHEIIIFTWARDKDSIDNDAILVINEKGNAKVTYRDNDGAEVVFEAKESFNMKSLNASFSNFINSQKLYKEPASVYEEGDVATEPQPGRQAIHITIVTVEDFKAVGNVQDIDPASYFTVIDADFNDHAPAALFSQFNKEDATLVKKLLYPER